MTPRDDVSGFTPEQAKFLRALIFDAPRVPPRVWATPEEAAAHLSVSTRLLEAWRAAGTGPDFRRSGRFIRYAFAELDSWVEAQGEART